MKKKYVLGVDGGNTKTQYYLFDLSGKLVGELKAGTCSHEKMQTGFEGCKREMARQLDILFSQSGISQKDLAYSVFGLAGADFVWQKRELEKILLGLGFDNFIVENDGYIALKAGSEDGTGVCSINGTGSVVVGIHPDGKRLQLGGIGMISDDRGGAYLGQKAAAAVYSELFRCGQKTILTEMLLNEFAIPDKLSYAEEIAKIAASPKSTLKVNLLLKKAERMGDAVAIDILSKTGESLGKTVAGCINNLSFSEKVNLVLAGSVWVKGAYQSMLSAFKQTIARHCQISNIRYSVLSQPPAIGAVIWGFEEINRLDKDMRKKLLEAGS
jgi:N-acetylglucosamine kinase-like BadF-type ATPase